MITTKLALVITKSYVSKLNEAHQMQTQQRLTSKNALALPHGFTADYGCVALKHAGLGSPSGGIMQDSSLHSETNLRPSQDQAAACSGWL